MTGLFLYILLTFHSPDELEDRWQNHVKTTLEFWDGGDSQSLLSHGRKHGIDIALEHSLQLDHGWLIIAIYDKSPLAQLVWYSSKKTELLGLCQAPECYVNILLFIVSFVVAVFQ